MRKHYFLTMLFALILSSCQSQITENNLIGKWYSVKKEFYHGESIKNNAVVLYEFTETELKDKTNPAFIRKASYKLSKDSIITFENNPIVKYKIVKITKDDLILLEYNSINPQSPFQIRYYFKREN